MWPPVLAMCVCMRVCECACACVERGTFPSEAWFSIPRTQPQRTLAAVSWASRGLCLFLCATRSLGMGAWVIWREAGPL